MLVISQKLLTSGPEKFNKNPENSDRTVPQPERSAERWHHLTDSPSKEFAKTVFVCNREEESKEKIDRTKT